MNLAESLFNPFTVRPWAFVASPVTGAATRETIDVLRALPQRSRVLDVGAGTGATARKIAHELGFQVDAVDASQAMIDEASRENTIRLTRASAIDLPFEDRTFEAVVQNYLYRYLTPMQGRFAVKEAARVLKPGGWLIVTDLNLPLLRPTRFPVIGSPEGRLMGAWADGDVFKQYFEEAGLTLVETRGPFLSFLRVYRRR